MTATRSFLVLFSLFALVLNTAGQFCTLDTGSAATGVILSATSATATFTTGSLTGVSGVYIEKTGTSAGKLWVVATTLDQVFRFASAADFSLGQAAEATLGTSGTNTLTATTLNAPTAITTDSSGTCWITDTSNNRIVLITGCNTATGALTITFGIGASPTTAGSGVSIPTGITCDNSAAVSGTNPIFYAQTSDNQIYAYPTTINADDMTATSKVAFTTTALLQPLGIRYFGTPKFLYVADGSGNRVVQIANNAGVAGTTTPVGATGTTSCSSTIFLNPSGVGIDTTNSAVYVADTGNNRIVFLTGASGTLATTITSFFPASSCTSGSSSTATSSPKDVDLAIINSEPTIVVADTSNSRVLKLCGLTQTITVSISISASPNTISISISNSAPAAASTASISISLSGVAASVAASGTSFISTSVTITTSTSFIPSITSSGSISITNSFTNSVSNSITNSITVSITNSVSVTISISNSNSISYSSSYSGSYTISTSNSYSITISRTVRSCGDAVVDSGEQCDEGTGSNGKYHSCCTARCRFKYGGKVCYPLSNCYGRGRCNKSGTCRSGKLRANKPCSTTGTTSGVKNGVCNISGQCIASS